MADSELAGEILDGRLPEWIVNVNATKSIQSLADVGCASPAAAATGVNERRPQHLQLLSRAHRPQPRLVVARCNARSREAAKECSPQRKLWVV
jgi:hypothetical protein